MIYKIFRNYGVLVLLILFMSTIARPGQNDGISPFNNSLSFLKEPIEPLQPEWQRIQSLLTKNDIAGIEDAVSKLQEKRATQIQQHTWENQDEQRYLILLARLCDQLTGGRIPDDRKDLLGQKLAISALQSTNQMSPVMEMQFVRYTWSQYQHEIYAYSTGRLNVEDWLSKRSEQTRIWLHPISRLEALIERNFDINDPKNAPSIVPVPKNSKVGIVSGIAPEQIKDPKVRAEYESALNANAEKARKLWEQTFLRSVSEAYFASLESHLVKIYSIPPYNIVELQGYLDTYVTDNKQKAKILKSVEDAIQRNVHVEKNSIPQTAPAQAEGK